MYISYNDIIRISDKRAFVNIFYTALIFYTDLKKSVCCLADIIRLHSLPAGQLPLSSDIPERAHMHC